MSYGTSVILDLPFADTGRPDLKPVADEVARRLAGALVALTS